LNHYITLYRDALSKADCENLIAKFEKHTECHRRETAYGKEDGWHMQFTQIVLPHHEVFSRETEKLKSVLLSAIAAYRKEHGIQPYQWPEKFRLEPIRMKRYLPNSDDRFDSHVDVSDYASARRFLVVFIYLNDDFEGGETDFTQFNVKVRPKQGNIVLFPPM